MPKLPKVLYRNRVIAKSLATVDFGIDKKYTSHKAVSDNT